MVYTALPDRRIPYDNDGTIVGRWDYFYGMTGYCSGADLISLQGASGSGVSAGGGQVLAGMILWFPEQREVTAVYGRFYESGYQGALECAITGFHGSNNSGNGLDGTWETASMPSGVPGKTNAYAWRSDIKPVSFTGAKKTIRMYHTNTNAWVTLDICYYMHIYGEKAAGQTPDDVIYINHDDTPGVEYAIDEDFGDQPLGTTVVRQFRVKNTSATKTANTINIQCNDADFAISTDSSTWVVTINLASLAAGAESPTYYVRCTTPAPGGLLGPRFARIVTTVASYT